MGAKRYGARPGCESGWRRPLSTRTLSCVAEPPDSAARLVLITHPALGADAFARGLVSRGLAACVNRLAATSTYRWKGEIEMAEEALLFVKTSAGRVPELERLLRELHPAEVPEFVVFEPVHVEARYGAWLAAECR